LNQGLDSSGVPVFKEAAARYGLDDLGYGTHSAWFDYELDGDLDLYVLNNAIEDYQRNVAKGTDTTGRGKSVDRIYREEDGRFVPTNELKTEGWGLGVAVQDFNHDGYPDIYVANDFLSNDFLLINQEGKSFRDEIKERIPHTSRNSMGVDVADLNGDGESEIMVVDMLPDDNYRVKTMFGDVPHQADRIERQRGYVQQYVRNTLQRNNGDGTFSDLAYQAGVAATDWSWTPLLADFDNDGRRDIFVSNGYPKDITNKDFIDFSELATQFGTAEAQLKKVMEALQDVDGVHQPNYFFRNEGDLSFSQPGWLPNEPTYSNGSVFVDLDRDGDLDLVTNNINEPAGVFRNQLRERRPEESHYLLIDLTGGLTNRDGLGTKIWVTYGDTTLYHEHYRQRGYLSTVDQLIHFGLGRNERLDRLTVRFPDGRG
ncbi:MAG: CRTAC1 family protein, partial [Bacteroidota bacterium]